jgi:hypothetical protein
MATIRNIAAALAILIGFNDPAFGCAACFNASSPGALRGYYISTILLSAMPLLLIACFVVILRRYRLVGGSDTTAETGSLMIFDNTTGAPRSVGLSGLRKAPKKK